MYGAYLGEGFVTPAIRIRKAAAELANNADRQRAIPTLWEAAAALRLYLFDLEGATLYAAVLNVEAAHSSAIEVLRSGAILQAFGLPSGSNLASIVREVDRRLGPLQQRATIAARGIGSLERAGRHGALTIAGVFDERPHDEARTLSLMENAYAWELAIQSLRFGIDPIRAWKEPEYRERLTQSEKENITHPSGEIDLSRTFLNSARPEGRGAGEQSASVVAICCSTEGGDLCTVLSSGSDYCCITASGLTCTCRYLCP